MAALLVSAAAFALAGFREGPLPGMTGGFGEPTCHKCHFDQPLDDPAGALRLHGVPRSYTPGRRYAITVDLARPGLKRGGFELSARFADGRQAGTLAVAGDRLQIVTSPDGAVQYAQHTARGSVASAPGALRWTVDWTAPPARDAVTFHAAGNASDDDASALGDFIYTAAARSGGPGSGHGRAGDALQDRDRRPVR
ncbi:MAG TPA: choice-of-anchor V domain-containing protein [Vicinamibacteria bacterium]